MRWPTAESSSSEVSTPWLLPCSVSSTSLIATLWSGMGVCLTSVSNPVFVCLIWEPSIPILSTSPLASTDSWSMSKS